MVCRQTKHKEPEWWTRRFDKTWRDKDNLTGKKESRRKVCKEKLSMEESLSQVESSTKEVGKEVRENNTNHGCYVHDRKEA